MYKNVQTNPEKFQLTQTLMLFYVDTNKIEIKKRQRISFRTERWNFPYRNHEACCEKLWFVKSLYPNLTQIGQIFYHGMLMSLHDSMPSFMNFRWILDLLEFKREVSQCLRPSDGGRVFDIHYHFLNGT